MAQTYYSPFFPDPSGSGSKGSTVPIITPTQVDVIEDQIDILTEQGYFDGLAPSAPTGLTLTSTLGLDPNGGQIAILTATWNPQPETDASRFDLAINEDGGNYIPAMVGIGIYTYQWNVKAGHTYCVKLRAVDIAGNQGPYCAPVCTMAAKDTVPPAAPTALTGSAAFETAFLDWVNPADGDLESVEVYHHTANVSGSAVLLDTVAAYPNAAGRYIHTGLTKYTDHYYWLKAVDSSGNKSGFSTGSGLVRTGGISAEDFELDVEPIERVDTLPNPVGYTGPSIVYNKTDKKLYRYDDDLDQWTTAVEAVDIEGELAAENIGAGIITATAFASSIKPVEIFNTFAGFPAAGNEGRQAYAKDTDKVYRDNGTAWIASVAATDMTGQIVSTQITDGAITTPKMTANSISGDRITAGTLDASKIVANSITSGQILAGAISATEIASGAITTAKMNANSINGDRILAGTLDASKIVALSITSNEIGANAITANKILAGEIGTSALAANAVVASKIAAGEIGTNHITVNTLNGDRIQTGTLNANKITASSIFSNTLYIGSATTDNLLSNVASRSADPASQVNARGVQINPGLILISGGTSLSDWRQGGDTTKIAGGSISANTVTANKLNIGSRAVQINDIQFSNNPATNQISWTAGSIDWPNDSGGVTTTSIAAGTGTWGGGIYYVWFDKTLGGAFAHNTTTAASILSNTNNIIIASYRGGTSMVTEYGRTVVDGENIRTGSIQADRLIANSITATYLTIGTVTTNYLGNQAVTDVYSHVVAGPIDSDGGNNIRNTISYTLAFAAEVMFYSGGRQQYFGDIPQTAAGILVDGNFYNTMGTGYGAYTATWSNIKRLSQAAGPHTAYHYWQGGGGGVGVSGEVKLYDVYLVIQAIKK